MQHVPTKFRAFLCSVMLVFSAAAFAAPYEVSYSGRLVGQRGRPLTGTVDLELKFYSSEKGKTEKADALGFSAVPLTEGMFTVTLALSAAEYAAIFDGATETWISVTEKATNTTFPRRRFYAVPYALKVPIYC